MAGLNIAPLLPELNACAPLSVQDINTKVNHEPRILDVRLAEALGFDRPRSIRYLIARHEKALSRLGEVCHTVRRSSGIKGFNPNNGRPGREYWLTKKQAIYIASKSETDNATDILIHVIEVFDAVTEGKPVKVRAHRRAKPAVTAEPAKIALPAVVEVPPVYDGPKMFEAGSNLLLDLKAAVMSAKSRMIDTPSLDFATAFESVLSDIWWKNKNPRNKPSGFLGDWNGERARPELRRKPNSAHSH